jgi:Tol biopolymer transport system component
MIAYSPGAEGTQLVWYDRSGKALQKVAAPEPNMIAPALSPEGALAVGRTVQDNHDVWLIDAGRLTRLTFNPGMDSFPVWAPDGTRIVFESRQKGPFNLYMKTVGGVGQDQQLVNSATNQWPLDWSRDGRFLLYFNQNAQTGGDIEALPMTGNDRNPIPVARTPFEERIGVFSPDSRWVAYDTNESGRFEIVVQPFPNPTRKWPVSTGGGVQPRWSQDGKELFFIAPDGKLMATAVKASGTSFTAGIPFALFQTQIASNPYKQQYDVSPDGRFVINQMAGDSAAATSITLILNHSNR